MRSASTRIAAIVLIVCAAIFVLVSRRDPGYVNLRPADGGAGPAVHRDAVTFVVEAPPFSRIDLSVNGRRAGSAYVPWNGHDVVFEATPIDTGRNLVVARATLWYAASRIAHIAGMVVDNPPARVLRSARVPASQRAVSLAPRSRNGRLLALDVREQEVRAAFAVQLRRGDPAIVALRAGRSDLPAFVDDVFGAPRFNRKPISSFFTGAHPRFYAGGDALTVSADSGYQRLRLEELPALAGDVEIANAFTGPHVLYASSRDGGRLADSRRWAYDTLRFHADGYHVAAAEPAPRLVDGTTLLWERPFADARTHVVMSLAFAPFSSVDALRRGLNLPVFAFAPHVVARFLAFSRGFVLAMPMFAYLALSRGRSARFAIVARRLIAVAVAADVFDACISAQPDVDGEILLIVPAMRALPAPLLNLFFAPALIGLVLALPAASTAHLAARMRSLAGAVVSDAANAVKTAALGFAALVAVGYAAGGLARFPLVYPAFIGAVLAAGLIGILVTVDWPTIPRAGGTRAAFTVATIAFAVVVAVPYSPVAYAVWATIPEHAGTAFADPLSPLPLTASFLRSLAPLCSLAFGLLLIARITRDPDALGLDRRSFARLALCCYAVLAGVVVLVPVGFALAWWTYPLIRARTAGSAAAGDPSAALAPLLYRGFNAIPLALAFVVVEIVLLLPSETRYLRELHTPFVALEVAGFLAVIVASLVVPAFAFAACNEQIAGGTGLRKGINVGLWAIACSLPAWFLRSDDAATAVTIVAVTALFYFVLGRAAIQPLTPAAAGRASRA